MATMKGHSGIVMVAQNIIRPTVVLHLLFLTHQHETSLNSVASHSLPLVSVSDPFGFFGTFFACSCFSHSLSFSPSLSRVLHPFFCIRTVVVVGRYGCCKREYCEVMHSAYFL